MSFYPSYQEQYAKLSTDQKEALSRIPHVEEIEGWLLLSEAAALYSLAESIKGGHPLVCEIGSWKGKSAYIFATGLARSNGTVYCVDPFDGDGDEVSKQAYKESIDQMGMTLLENFKSTMERYDLSKRIKILPEISVQARKHYTENKIDLLFIDGNHEYEAVKLDYDLWSPLIPSGGKIVLHDVGAKHIDGPRRVASECIIGSQTWTEVETIGEMVVATKV